MDRGAWKAAVHGVAEGWTRLSNFTFTFHFHALEKEMATHSSVLAWRIPGTGEPGGLLSMGSHRVGHDWSDLAAAVAVMMWSLKTCNSHHEIDTFQIPRDFFLTRLVVILMNVIWGVFKDPDLEKAEGLETKLPTFTGSSKKQESSRKTFTYDSLATLKPLTMWISRNWKIIKEMEIPDHLTWLLRNLYAGQEATVRTRHETTDWFKIGKGVHQGCILSPAYLTYMQITSWEVPG